MTNRFETAPVMRFTDADGDTLDLRPADLPSGEAVMSATVTSGGTSVGVLLNTVQLSALILAMSPTAKAMLASNEKAGIPLDTKNIFEFVNPDGTRF